MPAKFHMLGSAFEDADTFSRQRSILRDRFSLIDLSFLFFGSVALPAYRFRRKDDVLDCLVEEMRRSTSSDCTLDLFYRETILICPVTSQVKIENEILFRLCRMKMDVLPGLRENFEIVRN